MTRDPLVRVRRAALGSRLQELRNSRGFSQDQVADLAGVDRSFYAEVERGRTSPRVDWLHLVATALNIHISELFIEPARPARSEPDSS